jgi:hypothetical protein
MWFGYWRSQCGSQENRRYRRESESESNAKGKRMGGVLLLFFHEVGLEREVGVSVANSCVEQHAFKQLEF